MELSLPHMLHLFNVFRENKDSDNCAKVLEEECNKKFGIKSLYEEHDCTSYKDSTKHFNAFFF